MSSHSKISVKLNNDPVMAHSVEMPQMNSAEEQLVLGMLNRQELRRRWWHMSPGLIAILLLLVPHADPISPTLYCIFILAGTGLGLHILLRYRLIAREGNTSDRVDAVAGYAFSVLAMVLCFPGDLELALVTLAILAFGDGSATLIGKVVGGPALPWNGQKSWSGFLAFILVGGGMATLMYYGETRNPEAVFNAPFGLTYILMCGFAPAMFAALAESMESDANDNVRVGLAAGASVALIQWSTLGIS